MAGYLTWHRVSEALYTRRLIGTVLVAEVNQQGSFVSPACPCLESLTSGMTLSRRLSEGKPPVRTTLCTECGEVSASISVFTQERSKTSLPTETLMCGSSSCPVEQTTSPSSGDGRPHQ